MNIKTVTEIAVFSKELGSVRTYKDDELKKSILEIIQREGHSVLFTSTVRLFPSKC